MINLPHLTSSGESNILLLLNNIKYLSSIYELKMQPNLMQRTDHRVQNSKNALHDEKL